ncbi:MAG: SCO family protein [Nitrospinae bacterium]|nr:SCO family protein [Nitrospinota bacterium]
MSIRVIRVQVFAFFLLLFSLVVISTANASFFESGFNKLYELKALKMANDSIGRKVSSHTLMDQDGRRFQLDELTGSPLIVSFIYTGCPHICPTITSNLSEAVKKANERYGKKFNVLTIGFDIENDTALSLKNYGEGFVADFNQWRFATSDKETIEKMTKEFGFYYKKKGNSFEHLNIVTLLDIKGNVHTHVYGMEFEPEKIISPLEEIWAGKKGQTKFSQLFDKLKLLCSVYDPATKKYRIDYNLILVLGIQFILIMGTLIFFTRNLIYSLWMRCYNILSRGWIRITSLNQKNLSVNIRN